MEAHEAHEQHEHLEHAAHGSGTKHIAILIAVLAALLAIVDSGGKAAQNEQISANIHASDTWAFYQAKTIRSGILQTTSSLLDTLATPGDQATKAAALQANWKAEIDRLKSDPKSGTGRDELTAKARAFEEERDLALAAYHNFEYGGAALQLGIVLASASVITSMPALALIAAGLGALGTLLGGLGWFAPELLHHILG